MERPPVNTTWKDVFIPINDLGFNIINNIAAFGIFHGFPGYLDIHIAEISFTNAVVEVIPLSPNEEICYSDNHCRMTETSQSALVDNGDTKNENDISFASRRKITFLLILLFIAVNIC